MPSRAQRADTGLAGRTELPGQPVAHGRAREQVGPGPAGPGAGPAGPGAAGPAGPGAGPAGPGAAGPAAAASGGDAAGAVPAGAAAGEGATSSHPAHGRGDRWHWRRRLRAERPNLYRVYRGVVAVVGTLLVLLALATGPIPGPGGIPLGLLGLAVLASEFHWAKRLLHRAREAALRFGHWTARQPLWVRLAGTAMLLVGLAVVVCVALLASLGIPSWLHADVVAVLDRVPLLEPR